MSLTNTQKTKSRTKLYNAISGTKKMVGVGGRTALGSIVFANIPLVTETVTIGDFWFGFKVGAAEAPGTSAGTSADPHLCSVDTSLAAVGASLAAVILAETATTGAWGYLYPDDSVGVDFTTDTLTLNFWPGEAGNAITLAGSATDEVIVQPVTASLGRTAPAISSEYKTNAISTVGSTQNKEHYQLADGVEIGDRVSIIVNAIDASDTPAILGHFFTSTGVEASLAAAEDTLDLAWTGTSWKETNTPTGGSDATYTAAA